MYYHELNYTSTMNLCQCVLVSLIMTAVSYTLFLVYMFSSQDIDDFWCNLMILTVLLAAMTATTINLVVQCDRYSTYKPIMVV